MYMIIFLAVMYQTATVSKPSATKPNKIKENHLFKRFFSTNVKKDGQEWRRIKIGNHDNTDLNQAEYFLSKGDEQIGEINAHILDPPASSVFIDKSSDANENNGANKTQKKSEMILQSFKPEINDITNINSKQQNIKHEKIDEKQSVEQLLRKSPTILASDTKLNEIPMPKAVIKDSKHNISSNYKKDSIENDENVNCMHKTNYSEINTNMAKNADYETTDGDKIGLITNKNEVFNDGELTLENFCAENDELKKSQIDDKRKNNATDMRGKMQNLKCMDKNIGNEDNLSESAFSNQIDNYSLHSNEEKITKFNALDLTTQIPDKISDNPEANIKDSLEYMTVSKKSENASQTYLKTYQKGEYDPERIEYDDYNRLFNIEETKKTENSLLSEIFEQLKINKKEDITAEEPVEIIKCQSLINETRKTHNCVNEKADLISDSIQKQIPNIVLKEKSDNKLQEEHREDKKHSQTKPLKKRNELFQELYGHSEFNTYDKMPSTHASIANPETSNIERSVDDNSLKFPKKKNNVVRFKEKLVDDHLNVMQIKSDTKNKNDLEDSIGHNSNKKQKTMPKSFTIKALDTKASTTRKTINDSFSTQEKLNANDKLAKQVAKNLSKHLEKNKIKKRSVFECFKLKRKSKNSETYSGLSERHEKLKKSITVLEPLETQSSLNPKTGLIDLVGENEDKKIKFKK